MPCLVIPTPLTRHADSECSPAPTPHQVAQQLQQELMAKKYHHGRCLVGVSDTETDYETTNQPELAVISCTTRKKAQQRVLPLCVVPLFGPLGLAGCVASSMWQAAVQGCSVQ
eukprot:GHRR01012146.1.p2 GENE.GHRR01012146.1~~GHRR01012146.1.p2  ORF type:complete len:113 (+),score=23.12 GHRR01012146.1:707-1045(+)